MMRVLQIIGSLNLGGAESFITNLYQNIDRNKIQFDFAIYDSPCEEGYYHLVLGLGAKVYFLPNKKDDLWGNLYKIRRIVKENHYKIVWRHTCNCFGALDLMAAKCGGAKRLILHSHSSNGWGVEKFLHRILKPFINYVITDKLACSEKAGKWMFYRNFKIIRNGIILSRYLAPEDSQVLWEVEQKVKDKVVLGHVGRFVKEKNHEFLVELLAELYRRNNNIVLLLVGGGELTNKIRRKVVDLNLSSNVIFLGNRTDIPELLQMMDIFVMPSLFEGLPVTLIEAQAAGLPCVVSDRITQEVNVTGNVRFVGLEESLDTWAEVIMSSTHRPKQSEAIEAIRRAGFDIEEVAKHIEKELLLEET